MDLKKRQKVAAQKSFYPFSMKRTHEPSISLGDRRSRFLLLFQLTAELVERAYGQAAGVYYKKDNYAKAKQLVKAGLIYAPSSFGLQQRLNQLK